VDGGPSPTRVTIPEQGALDAAFMWSKADQRTPTSILWDIPYRLLQDAAASRHVLEGAALPKSQHASEP
jgi:hypothetical protein